MCSRWNDLDLFCDCLVILGFGFVILDGGIVVYFCWILVSMGGGEGCLINGKGFFFIFVINGGMDMSAGWGYLLLFSESIDFIIDMMSFGLLFLCVISL